MSPFSYHRVKSLTKDTSNSLADTCHALVDLAKYMISIKNISFVMLGKFTSDQYEKEFGKLHQGLGETYFITAQKVLEKVAITKANSFCK